jgi:CheY-like chemotaxis protein
MVMKVQAPTFPKRVLIVDDSADNRALVQLLVARMGYQVDTACSGHEAIEKASAEDFDLILMDVQMPEMDGFEAVQKLRQCNFTRPIVALTANAMKGDRERCLAEGFDDYLLKPIDRVRLYDSLKRHTSH